MYENDPKKKEIYGAALGSLKVGIMNAPRSPFTISVGGKFFSVVAEYDHYSVTPVSGGNPIITLPRETDRYMHEMVLLANAITEAIVKEEE